MIFSRAWWSLLRRNVVTYRKRNLVGSLLEIMVPVCFLWIMIAIRNASRLDNEFAELVSEVIPSDYGDIDSISPPVIVPLSYYDYRMALVAERCVYSLAFSHTISR